MLFCECNLSVFRVQSHKANNMAVDCYYCASLIQYGWKPYNALFV